MKDKVRLHPPPPGLIIDLVTPLTPSGDLDTDSLRRLLAHVSPYAAGIIIGSPEVGAGLLLPPEVRRAAAAVALAAAPPGLPIFLGITAGSTEATFELARGLAAVVKDAEERPVFWLDAPLWHHSNRGLPHMYAVLAAETGRPAVLVNAPGLVGRLGQALKHKNLRTAVLKKLAGEREIAGLIYQGEMARLLNYYQATSARRDFVIYEGDEVRFLTRPGAVGVASAGAQLFPRAWAAAARACTHPEDQEAGGADRLALWAASQGLVRLAEMYQGQPAALLKAGLTELGVIGSDAAAGGEETPAARREEFVRAVREMAANVE